MRRLQRRSLVSGQGNDGREWKNLGSSHVEQCNSKLVRCLPFKEQVTVCTVIMVEDTWLQILTPCGGAKTDIWTLARRLR